MSDLDPLLMLTGPAYRAAARHTDPEVIDRHALALLPCDCSDPNAWVAGFMAAVGVLRPLLLDVARSADETMAHCQRLARTQPHEFVFKFPHHDKPGELQRILDELAAGRQALLVLDDSPAVQVTSTPLALPKFARSQPALARILGMPANARCW